MINDLAFSVLPASSRAWISAFVAGACFVRGAIGVYAALWSAAFVRISYEFRQANTSSSSVLFTALGVGATGGW